MATLARGQKTKLADIGCSGSFPLVLQVAAAGMEIDIACFGLDANEKLSDDRYMVFFNQTACPGDAVTLAIAADQSTFKINLAGLPSSIQKLVFTASITGTGSMRSIGASNLRLGDATFSFSGSDFQDEKAIIVGELYQRDNQWRFGAVGQGFNGGLSALLTHFGGTEVDAAPEAPAHTASVSLLKKVEQEAPRLVNLVKQASVSLEKVGLSSHKAKVCLVLDISGSMYMLYKKGLVQTFSERILALGCKFDDDQEIDVFLFGEKAHQPAPMGLANSGNYVEQVIKQHPLEGDTKYGLAMETVRKFYFPDSDGKERKNPLKSTLPVYVMFVTDGTTSDKARTENQLRWSSKEAIFWQFMGIGKGKKAKVSKMLSSDSDFPFLEKLDELDGRFIDNANYFSVASPDEHSDAELYDLLMTEYPGWLKLAKQQGLLAS
jgi:stress response protein SCP2